MPAALKWVLRNPHVNTTIPSMTDMDQLDENLRAMSARSARPKKNCSPSTARTSARCTAACAASATAPAGWGCRCRICCAILTYADGYGQFALGRERFSELSPEHTSARCADCPGCTVQCPHGVQVAQRLTRAQELFAC